jgi:hypothetical protein
MTPDILIIRDADGYRLLHGHLRLADALRKCREVAVETKEDGIVTILKTAAGLFVSRGDQCWPLLRN